MLFELKRHHLSQEYSELSQKSKMERFAKIVNSWMKLTMFAERPILDVWLGSENASTYNELSST